MKIIVHSLPGPPLFQPRYLKQFDREKKENSPTQVEVKRMPMTEEATPSDVDEYTSWQTQSIWDRCVCARQISCTQYETGRFTRLN